MNYKFRIGGILFVLYFAVASLASIGGAGLILYILCELPRHLCRGF